MLWRRKRGKSCSCWICLEEGKLDSNWYVHKCGCNLQVHKSCYIQWIYSSGLNELNQINDTFDLAGYVPAMETAVKATLLNKIDRHPAFHQNSHLWMTTGIIRTLPVPLKIVRVPIYMMDTILRGNQLLGPELPLSFVSAQCPQCKKELNLCDLGTSPSFATRILDIAYFLKRSMGFAGMMVSLIAVPLNATFFLMKLSLFQLRCLFPESALRILLDIPTSDAMDIYTDSSAGIQSIPTISKLAYNDLDAHVCC